jgi:hypothetical protein
MEAAVCMFLLRVYWLVSRTWCFVRHGGIANSRSIASREIRVARPRGIYCLAKNL